MQPIGTEVQEKIQIVPAKIILHRDVYVTYACLNCKENGISTPIVQTPKEPALIPGSYASAEAVAHFAVQKFVMGSPLYRQEQEWNRQGFMISRQTMSNWLIRCSDDWLVPVYDAQAATPSIPLSSTNTRRDVGRNTPRHFWKASADICRRMAIPDTPG